MALAAIIGSPKGPKIGAIQVDVALTEAHGQAASVSEHPVEVGSDMADHRRVHSPTLTMTGVVSDAKATLREQIQSEIAQESTSIKYAQLLELFENEDVFEVVTGLRVYPDMVFETFQVTRDASTGQAIQFSASLKQIQFARAETVAVAPTENKVKPKVKKGPKATKPAPASSSEPSRSSLKRISGGVGSVLGL